MMLHAAFICGLQAAERDSCPSRLALICEAARRTVERQFLVDKSYPDLGCRDPSQDMTFGHTRTFIDVERLSGVF
jgi:hypothetical protein